MTAKKTTSEPAEFPWVSLAQPVLEDPTPYEVQETSAGDPPPYWVQDKNGSQFATYALVKGLKRLDESPFTRSGELRTSIPGGTDTAPAD